MFVFKPNDRPKARRGTVLQPRERLEARDLPALIVPLDAADPVPADLAATSTPEAPPTRWPGAEVDPASIPPWTRGPHGKPGPKATQTRPVTLAAVLDPLRVVQIQRRGLHRMPTRFSIAFNQPLDPGSARDPGNYVVVAEGPDLALGTRNDVPVRLRSVRYRPGDQVVVLTTARPVALVGREYVVGVDGDPATGVRSATGAPLDGGGGPGSDSFTLVNFENFVPPAALTRAIRTPSGKNRTPATGIIRNG